MKIKRIGAYLLDMLIILLVGNLLNSVLPNYDKLNELSTKELNVMTEYMEEIAKNNTDKAKELEKEINDISYDFSKKSVPSSLLTIAIYFLYFVVFQRYNNGQTIGKRLLKIEIVGKDKEEVNFKQLLIRSIILYPMLFDLINIMTIMLLNKSLYWNISTGITLLRSVIFIICIITLFTNCALHDRLAGTTVISSDDQDLENNSKVAKWKDNAEKEKKAKKYKNHTSGKRKE